MDCILHIAGISFFLRLFFFAFSGSQNKLAPMKSCPGVQGWSTKMLGYNI